MSNGSTILVGSIAGIAIAITAYCLAKSKKEKSLSVVDLLEEKMVVTELRPDDLATWFELKNPKGQYNNLVMQMNDKMLASLHISPKTRNELIKIVQQTENCIIQAIASQDSKTVICCRAILYDTIQENLKQLLEQNNGVFIVD